MSKSVSVRQTRQITLRSARKGALEGSWKSHRPLNPQSLVGRHTSSKLECGGGGANEVHRVCR